MNEPSREIGFGLDWSGSGQPDLGLSPTRVEARATYSELLGALRDLHAACIAGVGPYGGLELRAPCRLKMDAVAAMLEPLRGFGSSRVEVVPGWTGAELEGALAELKASSEAWVREVAVGLHTAMRRSSRTQVGKQVKAFEDFLAPARKAWLDRSGDGPVAIAKRLLEARREAAQREYQSYEFDAEVEDSDGWGGVGDSFELTVYVREQCAPLATEGVPSKRVRFLVEFDAYEASIKEAYAVDESGERIGWRSGSGFDRAVKADEGCAV